MALYHKENPCLSRSNEMIHSKNNGQQMHWWSFRDRNSLIKQIRSCGKQEDLSTSRKLYIHAKGFFVLSTIAKCGAFEGAGKVFEKLPDWDVVSWSALFSGYAQHGYGHTALKCFDDMQIDGFLPDAVTFTCVLKLVQAVVHSDRRMHTYRY